MRGRRSVTSYIYGDDGRVVRSVTASPWTDEDRALLLALARRNARYCSGCGQPKATAWHPDNDGWFEVTDHVTCHGCTALKADGTEPGESVEPVTFAVLTDTRDYTSHPLPPLEV